MNTMVPTTNDSESQSAWNPPRSIVTSFATRRRRRVRPALPPGTCALPARRPRILVHGSARDTLERLLTRIVSDKHSRLRPALTLLVLGAERADKAAMARGLARGLFGTEDALVEVTCGEYRDARRAAELLGVGEAPETKAALLTQRRLDAPHLRAMIGRRGRVGANAGLPLSMVNPSLVRPMSVVLFDEIEKAHPMLWDALLEILHTGRLALGDGSVTSFTHSIVVMTSGAGAREIGAAAEKRSERNSPPMEELKADLSQVAKSAASASFPADLLGRVDEIHVAGPTSRAALERAFDRFLLDAHARVLREGMALSIRVSPEARKFILERGRRVLFGPRRLCRVMEVELIEPLLRLVRAGSLRAGDVVDVVRRETRLVFFRNRGRGMLAV